MIDLKKIKLIIWDLDDTLWTGTLSEDGYQLSQVHSQLIKDLTDAGIINSICSKNDYEPTKVELQTVGLWEYFVFPSINWDNKGKRIQCIIDQMALRPVNVLFIDDNISNLQEAQFYLPDLQIAMPDAIEDIIEQLSHIPKTDTTHKRLKQYKVLEEKAIVAESFDSNEEFLFSSNIRVDIHTDCLPIAERLHELILRTNQLNFTKKRITLEELITILNDTTYDCGYITVKDNFGDYGIVGFYARKGDELEHFLFSCRTIGQMIEQWVYAQLGFPKLKVVGEVRTQLNTYDCPKWINQDNIENNEVIAEELSCKILLKGPCDLSNTLVYINNQDTTTEFTYIKVDSGQEIDTYNHSVHIRGLYEYTDEQNQQIANDCPFVDPEMLKGTFYTGQYDVIFLSSLIESTYHIYKKKNSSIFVVHRAAKDKEREKAFFEQYEYVGLTTPQQYKDFLLDTLDRLSPKTTLCIILGVTHPILDSSDEVAKRHATINDVVKDIARTNTHLKYIDVDEFVKTREDITDNINHYKTRVYYEIAQVMTTVIKDVTGIRVKSVNVSFVFFISFLKKIRLILKKLLPSHGRLYLWLKSKYLKIIKK